MSMNAMGLLYAFGIHLILSGFVYVLLHRGILHLPRAYIIIVLLVPVFGLASLFCIELALRMPTGYTNRMHKGAGQYATIAKDEDDNARDVVPLEEALLMSDVKTRRALMMNILHSEPARYIDQLKMACLNSDMEVTHYATTTIMEIQRDFDLSMQRLDQRLSEQWANADALDEAIGQLSRYLASGLLDGYSLHRLRRRYSELLARKARQQPMDQQTRLASLQNKMELGDFTGAEEEMDLMLKLWPNAKEVWLLALRLAVERRDRRLFGSLVRQMGHASIHLSTGEKESLQFWLGAGREAKPDKAQKKTVTVS